MVWTWCELLPAGFLCQSLVPSVEVVEVAAPLRGGACWEAERGHCCTARGRDC